MSLNPQSLLILSCSERKRCDKGLLPAIERYDGPAFRVLRRFLKEHPTEQLDIFILTAKFGLISSNQHIPYYDQRMTALRAQELHLQVITELRNILDNRTYQRFCICMGKDYLQALDGYKALISSGLTIYMVSGPQGTKLAELHNWLYGLPAPRRQKLKVAVSNGKAQLRGVEISITQAEVLDKARQALQAEQGDSANYHLWYVQVDEQKVSPKWLVSHLTGLPVSSFQAREARNVLQHLGIGVHHI